MPEEIPNPQLKLAFDFVQLTNTNIFLTGKAGTGKTTFLRNLKTLSPKRMIVVAPTGVAAINAGGVTIHSFFQMHFGPHIPGQDEQPDLFKPGNPRVNPEQARKFNREKINIIRSLDLLIIDEISMVRADLLDAVDEVLRRYKDRYRPFGGVQLLMIGDLQQLAPVVKEDELEMLRPYYQTLFFFGSRALQKTAFKTIELKHIYRQRDEVFINLLNKVRDNNIDKLALDDLNKRFIPGFNPHEDEGYITLTTHNYQSQAINEAKLNKIARRAHIFNAVIQGDFPEYSYPADFELVVKIGAQVMFVKNDVSREKLFYNGKIGKITSIEKDIIYVKCEGDETSIPVEQAEWQNNKYSINEETKEITETEIGKFIQYPLKLAWAITIHKSQGLTFEKAIIDANAAFAHGQVYVALSRCKTFEGLVLSSPISQVCIKSDTSVLGFSHEAEQNQPGEAELLASKIAYQQTLLVELLDFTPLQRRLNFCLKIIKENTSVLLPAFVETFSMMNTNLDAELAGVSTKFKPHIGQFLSQQPEIETNEPLQERIKKASLYFEEKINLHVCKVLQNLEIETDNKAVRKSLKESIENLFQEAFIRSACFKSCQSGFYIKTYLDTKAKASIEKVQLKPESKAWVPEGFAKSTAHGDLLKYLKVWRSLTAESEEVPLFMVLPQVSLYEIVEYLPVNNSELKKINGIGKKKLAKYGGEILAIVRNYLKISDEKLTESELPEDDLPLSEKPEKGKTQRISFEMFQSGKTIPQIALERSFAVSTIEGHLSTYVRKGELKVEEFVSPEKFKLISEYFAQNENVTISEAKSVLGNDISFGELRMVQAAMLYQSEQAISKS